MVKTRVMPKESKPKPETTDEDVFTLLEKIQSLRAPTIEKLKADIADRLEKLSLLGEQLKLVSVTYEPAKRGPKPKADKPAPGPSANYDEARECKFCKTKGHDGRAHRRQSEPKKKFTEDELKERGLLAPQ